MSEKRIEGDPAWTWKVEALKKPVSEMTVSERFYVIYWHASGYCGDGLASECWEAIRNLSAPEAQKGEGE